MRRLVFCLLMIAGLAGLAGCAAPKPPPGSKQSHARVVSSPYGNFSFTNIQIFPDSLGVKVKADVASGATNRFEEVWFDVAIFNGNNTQTGKARLGVSNFAPGTSRSTETLVYLSGKDTQAFDLKFSEARLALKYVFKLTKPVESEDTIFDDKEVNIGFSPSTSQIGMVIRNKTETVMRIDWNNVAYVDTDGLSHRVIHEGVKMAEKNAVMPPTVIPPGSMINDLIYPASYISYSTGTGRVSGSWNERALFPKLPAARGMKGKEFKVFLPIEINGKVRNLNFVFQIKDAIEG
ncbi:hypothetical protein [Hydrogenophaga sp. PBL-H3]|uniref:hypothetical protein n=1 Tax=Hydrogenophaga sp. PBL-H3 TaxID=434010 RepID=UPI0013204452|nr:hypothetical protein [Hydrogenophaga sp. PBL-H3]QHE76779.1 hypothetical protein F9Z45_12275 [Hydrogenophaga sp. PBL-H3]QHE81203.1 hypothetical protein F9Z44_12275 [Hydrogenophaga sp. PBL-H3]